MTRTTTSGKTDSQKRCVYSHIVAACVLVVYVARPALGEGQTTDLHFRPPAPAALQVAIPHRTISEAARLEFDASAGQRELSLEILVEEVLARHPTLTAAQAAWRAAAARYPQVVSLDDPMLDTIFAPASLGSNDVDAAYAIQIRQKIPWPGKLGLRGQSARLESQAAFQDVADARLQLAQLTRQAFYEYFLAQRMLELNNANRRALALFRRSAVARYEASLVTQQDVFLADVELAELEQREFELLRNHRVAVARINTLLLRLPTAPLPPPPASMRGVDSLPSPDLLRQLALEQRPDMAAAVSRWRAEQAGIALAEREFKPDLEIVGRYDTFWLPQDKLVGQVGVSLNIPLAQERRRAAVREAAAETSQRRAELERLAAQVQFEVQEAFERVTESRAVVLVYQDRSLPAATNSVSSAESSYQTGKVDFLRLVEAQRRLIALRQKQVESLAQYHIRVADLQRVLGGPLPLSPPEELPRSTR